MTDNITQQRKLSCDRCGVVTDLEADAPYPDNWRKLQMAHPDTHEVIEFDLHPECAQDLSDLFLSNQDCPSRPAP